jgi:hypothetical protein
MSAICAEAAVGGQGWDAAPRECAGVRRPRAPDGVSLRSSPTKGRTRFQDKGSPKGAIGASGADHDAPCARDYSAEVFLRFDTRDRPSAWHGALDGAGNGSDAAGLGLTPSTAPSGAQAAGAGVREMPCLRTRWDSKPSSGPSRWPPRSSCQLRATELTAGGFFALGWGPSYPPTPKRAFCGLDRNAVLRKPASRSALRVI